MAEIVIHKVQAPDGSILKVEAPADTPPEQVVEFANRMYQKSGGADNRVVGLQDEYRKANERMLVAEQIAIDTPTKENRAAYERSIAEMDKLRDQLVKVGGEGSIPDLMAEMQEPETQAVPPTPASEQDFQAQKARLTADLLGAGAGAAIAKGAEMGQHGVQAVSALRQLPELLKNAPQAAPGTSSGAKWLQNWGGIAKEGFQGGVPEAAGQYNKMKPQGQIMKGLASRGLVSPQPVQPGVFTGGQLSISGQPAPAPAAPAPGPLSQAGSMGKKALGVVTGSPVISGALGGLSAASSGQEFFDRYKQGDLPGMMISGTGVAGGALQMVPHPASRALGAGLSAASPLTMYLYDKLRSQQTVPPTPEELTRAAKPAFVFPSP